MAKRQNNPTKIAELLEFFCTDLYFFFFYLIFSIFLFSTSFSNFKGSGSRKLGTLHIDRGTEGDSMVNEIA